MSRLKAIDPRGAAFVVARIACAPAGIGHSQDATDKATISIFRPSQSSTMSDVDEISTSNQLRWLPNVTLLARLRHPRAATFPANPVVWVNGITPFDH